MTATTTRAADEAAPSDWVRDIHVRQIDMLSELAESGLRLAQAIEREATEGKASTPSDCALAHGRVAKGVRLTLMLQAELMRALRQYDKNRAFDARSAAEEKARQDAHDVRRRKKGLARILKRIAEHEGHDAERAEHLRAEARERLDREDLYGDVFARPTSELIAAICQDLGLSPDWSRLAQEAWAREEIANGEVGWPLAALEPPDPLPTE